MFGPAVAASRGVQQADLANAKGGNLGPYIIKEKSSSGEFQDDEIDPAFNDSKVRSKFVFKVYTILTIQLTFTTLFNLPFLLIDNVQEFAIDHQWILYIFMALFLIPYFMLACCENTRRTFPTNIILLLFMTLGMAGVCGFSTAKLDTVVVIYSFMFTVLVTVVITVMAILCPFDFTSHIMVFLVMVNVLLMFVVVAVILMLVFESNFFNMLYSGIIVLIFSLYLMFDTQAIIGGRRVTLSPEEYILGAVQLYVDIILIFLNFLDLIGACIEND